MSAFRVNVIARNPKYEELATPPVYETIDEVVFAEPSDMVLLGAKTLEGFGVAVDNIAHRFVATTTIVAIGSKAACESDRFGDLVIW